MKALLLHMVCSAFNRTKMLVTCFYPHPTNEYIFSSYRIEAMVATAAFSLLASFRESDCVNGNKNSTARSLGTTCPLSVYQMSNIEMNKTTVCPPAHHSASPSHERLTTVTLQGPLSPPHPHARLLVATLSFSLPTSLALRRRAVPPLLCFLIRWL